MLPHRLAAKGARHTRTCQKPRAYSSCLQKIAYHTEDRLTVSKPVPCWLCEHDCPIRVTTDYETCNDNGRLPVYSKSSSFSCEDRIYGQQLCKVSCLSYVSIHSPFPFAAYPKHQKTPRFFSNTPHFCCFHGHLVTAQQLIQFCTPAGSAVLFLCTSLP